KNEEMILLSIWKLGDNAYIVTIRKKIEEIWDKAINFGSLCNTLSALTSRGYLVSEESEPTSKKGGRRKVLYFLTLEGKRALKHVYEVQRNAWDGIADIVSKIE
ncbi:MAG: PadR family transcriptional regulator, partial [bacterium]|nr:PadR family transcriptional regulator [bacterium]